jgi:hypothetical protein
VKAPKSRGHTQPDPPKPGISAIMFEENPSNLFFYLLVDDLPIFLDETIHYGFQRYDYIIQLGWLTAKNDQKIYPSKVQD